MYISTWGLTLPIYKHCLHSQYIYIYVYDLAFHVFTVFDMAVNSFPQDLFIIPRFGGFVPSGSFQGGVKITILLGKWSINDPYPIAMLSYQMVLNQFTNSGTDLFKVPTIYKA